jgi:hypothetical protein
MTESDVMAYGLLVSRILLGASLAAFGPVLAQAPPDAPASQPTSAAGTPAAPAAPAAQGSDTSAAPTQSPAPPSPGAPTAAPAASPAPAAPADPAAPSADTLKKARVAGYRPETKNGTTMYCQETASVGTRFATKKCIDEQQLKGVLDVQHQQQDSMRKPMNCTGGPGCGAG